MKRILFILLLCTLSLTMMIAGKMWTLRTGELVLLETQPVDPRSLFRGDYVRINLAINTLNVAAIGGDDFFNLHDEVFVVLEPGQPRWKPLSMHREYPPIVAAERVVIRGVIDKYPAYTSGDTPPSEYSVAYGIESYFVPEGEGIAIERELGAGDIALRVAVDSSGNAAIHALLVDGEALYEEGFF